MCDLKNNMEFTVYAVFGTDYFAQVEQGFLLIFNELIYSTQKIKFNYISKSYTRYMHSDHFPKLDDKSN